MEAIADYTNHLQSVPLEQQTQSQEQSEVVKQKEKVKKRTFSINARALMPSNWSGSNSHGRKLSRQSGASTSSAAVLTTTATAGGYHTKSVLSTPQ